MARKSKATAARTGEKRGGSARVVIKKGTDVKTGMAEGRARGRTEVAGVWRWLAVFAEKVRGRDFEGGKKLFTDDCHGFGTVVAQAEDRATLVSRQWGYVWPRTSGFVFIRAGARVVLSADGSQAVAVVRWKACNQPAPVRRVYDRRGRATVVLILERTGAWKAAHTHFSFDPPVSSGREGAESRLETEQTKRGKGTRT